jgi:hypothetical protein
MSAFDPKATIGERRKTGTGLACPRSSPQYLTGLAGRLRIYLLRITKRQGDKPRGIAHLRAHQDLVSALRLGLAQCLADTARICNGLTANLEDNVPDLGRHRTDGAGEVAGIFHLRAIDRSDYIACFNPSLRGGTTALRLIDHRACGFLQAEAVGDIGGHWLDLHAEPAARDMAFLLELGHYHLRGVRWNVEANADRAARRRKDRGVHADHIAVDVKGRSARITLVDGCVDLHIVVVWPGTDVAAARRDDARRDSAAETERIADCDHPVADLRCMLGEFHKWEVLVAVDLNQGEIGLGVRADHFCGVDCAIIGRDLDRCGVINHVIVGHRVAVCRDEEARAFAGNGTMSPRRLHV